MLIVNVACITLLSTKHGRELAESSQPAIELEAAARKVRVPERGGNSIELACDRTSRGWEAGIRHQARRESRDAGRQAERPSDRAKVVRELGWEAGIRTRSRACF
jgi:hypothetical protein